MITPSRNRPSGILHRLGHFWAGNAHVGSDQGVGIGQQATAHETGRYR